MVVLNQRWIELELLGAVTDDSARLLAADGTTRIYFQPNGTFSGTIATAITFRAWDRTSGSNGQAGVDTTTNGGTTAFSSATDSAELEVIGVNDAPVFTSASTVSVPENQTSVLTVTATDEDGDTVTYSLTGGTDQSEFAIDTNSGVLTFVSSPDYENPSDVDTNNVYEVEVTADDGNGETTSQIIQVTVTDANDSPVITSSDSITAAENQTSTITVTALDEDLPAQTIGFSLTGGADQLKFAIDAGTGELTFLAAPDFEIPDDTDLDNVYEVEVTANDGNGGATAQLISVTVTDANDAPVITTSSTVNSAENQTNVLTVASSIRTATRRHTPSLVATIKQRSRSIQSQAS